MSITERIDNITGLKPEYSHANIPAPESVKIELTGKCNFACSFCARSMVLREQKDMDRELYSRLIREMHDAGVKELGMFYLGESFMVPWLYEAIAEAKNVGFEYVFITTNGSLSSPEKVKACMEAGLDSLKFSFNYADAGQLEEIAGVKGAFFQRIVDNIYSARQVRDEGKYPCRISASYIEYDGEQAKKMTEAVDLIRGVVDEVYALPLYNQANLVADEEAKKGWAPTAGNRGRAANLRDPLPCWAVFQEGHITWDGKLSACCFDHNDFLTMADLTHVSFLEGWNSAEFIQLRHAHLKKDVKGTACEGCVAYQ